MDRRRFLQSSIAVSVMAALPAAQARAALQALTQVSGDVLAVTGDGEEISLERARQPVAAGKRRLRRSPASPEPVD